MLLRVTREKYAIVLVCVLCIEGMLVFDVAFEKDELIPVSVHCVLQRESDVV